MVDDLLREKQVEVSRGEAMTFDLDEFGVIGRLRVLKTVAKHGPLNITLLGRKTNMNHTSCDIHVKKLIEMGLIAETRYAAIRMIKPTFTTFSIDFKRGMDEKFRFKV